MNKSTSGVISQIHVPKPAQMLADQLRGGIVSGTFATGAFLPNERALMAESGLSRAAVRDALRILEADGLITTRIGRSGGSMVTVPPRDSMTRSVELFVRTNGVSLPDLVDCRMAVEPMLARLAAANRSDADLQRLRDLQVDFVEAIGSTHRFTEINLDWHLAVARCGRNEPLIAFMEAISAPIRDALDLEATTSPALRLQACQAHEAIIRAIADGDEAAAMRRMERHISGYRDVARKA